jgi:hypothetical protein
MSEFDGDSAPSVLALGARMGGSLMAFLESDDIVPGSAPSYQTCKTIYTYHPLGAKIAEEPIKRAMSKARTITVGNAPDKVVEAFEATWKKLGCARLVKNTHAISRVYGIGALAVLADGVPADQPLPMDRLHELELSFNVLDPLNTAGSLVMSQDPNSPKFLKPTGVSVSGKAYHPSRTAVLMNEQPIYIEWTSSAYGFVGRSVYQRALYPLKTYVQTMITDQAVTEKAALLVMKLKAPGSMIDKISRGFYGMKRQMLKGSKTGNVLSIGDTEGVESINFTNLKDAAEFARTNCIKNIATAAPMPATMISQETLQEGFGEGTEDAEKEKIYIEGIREEVEPVFSFLDPIVMRQAWTPEWYEGIQREFRDEYGDVSFEQAFVQFKNDFKAQWPNVREESDAEKAKTDDVVTKAAIAAYEVLSPKMDPENAARMAKWLEKVFLSRPTFENLPMDIDEEALESYVPPEPVKGPDEPVVESSHE